MSKPRLLMLDEPSLGLAPAVVLRLYGVVRELKDNEEVRRAYLGL